MKIAAPIVEECMKLAGLLIPAPSVKDVKLLSESEEAGTNSERLKLVRSLLAEVKGGTECPSCKNKAVQIEREVEALEKTVVTQEKVLKLREGLKDLLEEAKGGMPQIFETEQSVQALTSTQEVGFEPTTAKVPASSVMTPTPARPESGRTTKDQSEEHYCLECVEGHTMKGATEARHAEDRLRTAGHMTEGVSEKIRVALQEISGIDEDVKNLKGADPEVKKGLEELLDESRWIRKEFGLGGRGLTVGKGTLEDVQELRSKISAMQEKTYKLVGKCPTCLKRIK